MTFASPASLGEPVIPLSRAEIFFDGQYSMPRLHHPEGVAIGPDGALWCGNAEGDILRVDTGDGSIEKIASTGGFTLGIAFDGRGFAYVCDQRSASVWRLEIATRELTRLDAPGMRIPNYPVVDAHRNCLYVSDSFAAREAGPGVWRYDLITGQAGLWWSAPMTFANGMAISDDGNSLFVAETFARKVTRIAIGAHGEPSEATTFIDNLPGLPDGIAFDGQGTLFVACYEPSCILRVDKAGAVEVYAHDPSAELLCHPTNIAFAGAAIYTANLGRWHLTRIQSDTSAEPVVSEVQRVFAAGRSK